MRNTEALIARGMAELKAEAPLPPSPEFLLLRAQTLGRTQALERATGRLDLLMAGIYGMAAVVVAVIAVVHTAA